jgi:hypothetical protein
LRALAIYRFCIIKGKQRPWSNIPTQIFPSPSSRTRLSQSDVSYVLWGWPAGKEPKLLMEGVSFDQRGVLVCSGRPGFCKGKGPDDPVNIQTTAAPGEMKRFAVVSRDGRVAGFADAVPFPHVASPHLRVNWCREKYTKARCVSRSTIFSGLVTRRTLVICGSSMSSSTPSNFSKRSRMLPK